MDQHVTYHPITDELLQSYRYYVSGDDGTRVASEHCASVGMDEATTTRFLNLLPHFAAPAAYPFDQTHGFSIALTQGFFGPYFYINAAQLSALGDVLVPYTRSWQETLGDWDAARTAQNTVLSQFSSGVFIAADKIAQFMSDAHALPELAQALGNHFPGDKLATLWSALQYAHDAGTGLLEASGAIEPNVADLASSTCFTRLSYCDPASLEVYRASQQVAPAMPPAPELSLPPHLADRVAVNPGDRLPTTPSLTARLRAKRGEAPAAAADQEQVLQAAPEPDGSEQLPPPPAAPATADEQLPPPPPAPADNDEELPPPPAAVDDQEQPAPPPASAAADEELPPPPAPADNDEELPPPPPPSDDDEELPAPSDDDEQLPAPPAPSDDDEQLPPPPPSASDDVPPPPAPDADVALDDEESSD